MYIADALSRAYLPETNESLVPELEVNEVNLTDAITTRHSVQWLAKH